MKKISKKKAAMILKLDHGFGPRYKILVSVVHYLDPLFYNLLGSFNVYILLELANMDPHIEIQLTFLYWHWWWNIRKLHINETNAGRMWRISWRSLTKAVANLCTVLQTTEVSKLLLLKPLLLRISAENSPVKLSRFTRYSLIIACDLKERFSLCKVHIFWEGKKFLQNLHLIFDRYYIGQIYGWDFAKFCGLLGIYEL